MHLACRYGSSHYAVKLALPRRSWHSTCRSFSIVSARLNVDNPNLHPPGVLGTYVPKPAPNPSAQNIAVIGGGIAGLATAFHLTRDLPAAKITIFEKNDRIGGWIDSEQVDVDDGTVLFEWGPRSLRPDIKGNGLATLQLLYLLGNEIGDNVRAIHRSEPPATNRFIYYPDHLVRMPAPSPGTGLLSSLFSNLRTVLTEPIFRGVIPSLLAEPTVACRPANTRDESVGDFMSRRFGKVIADNLLSALFHGIYAGDLYKLSMRTLLPNLWHLENRDQDGNGVLMEIADLMFKGHILYPFEKVQLLHRTSQEMDERHKGFGMAYLPTMQSASVYSFTKGIGQLTDVLLSKLQQNPNVRLATGSAVDAVGFDATNQKVRIKSTQDEAAAQYDYAICTLSQRALSRSLTALGSGSDRSAHASLKSRLEAGSPSGVNVMVVNLYSRESRLPIPPGFGYLIPRSIATDQNPERALGVIFASETAGPRGKDAVQTRTVMVPKPEVAMPESGILEYPDTPEGRAKFREDFQEEEKTVQVGQDTASGTKLSVMLGGHWWDGWPESDLPSEEEAIEMAKSVISRHLGVQFEPMLAKARLQRNCIPQYQVGYRDDMGRIHNELVKDFHGRLKVAGVWWQGGVGVNDCIKSAREASRSIREAWDDQTGLERFTENEKWVLMDRRTGKQTMDPMQK